MTENNNIAEKAVLGSMIKENYLIIESNLAFNQFNDPINRRIFQAMTELRTSGKNVDMITLLTSYSPQELGGANYVNDLSRYSHIEKFDSHVDSMLEVWREREKQNILNVAMNDNWGIDRITSELGLLTNNKVNDHSDISEMLVEVFEDPFIEREIKEGAPSGIKTLDLMTNGFQNGELTVIAARPSMGKSDVMLQIAKDSGWKGYLPVIYSLEMSSNSLRDRLIASTGRFSRNRMRDPYRLLTNEQKNNWTNAIGMLSKTNIQIYERSGQTIAEMRMKLRKQLSERKGMKPIVIIDYLTLIQSTEKIDSMHLRVSEITKSLKGMAREFDCPVIVLAQLNRGVEKREDKRPLMSDVRESGSIEEDADVIVFLYRDSYYSKDENDNVMELIVAKNRNGPVGTAKAGYNKFTGEVFNLAADS